MYKKGLFLSLLVLTLLLSGCTLTLGEIELGSVNAETKENPEPTTSEDSFKIGEVIYYNYAGRNREFSFGGFVNDSILINVTIGKNGNEFSYPLFISKNQKVQLPNTNIFISVKDMKKEEGEIHIEFSEESSIKKK